MSTAISRADASSTVPVLPRQQEAGSTYQVQSGDTLGSIANAHGTTVEALKEANPAWKNRGADTVLLGGELTLPGAAPSAQPGALPDVPAASSPETPRAERNPGSRVVTQSRETDARARLENALPKTEAPSLQALRGGAVMEVGAKGPAAEHVNNQLRRLGFNAPNGDEYTSATQSAVRTFQHQNDIQKNGKVGPTTLAALDSATQGTQLKVPYFSQFDSRVERAGDSACFRASKKMAQAAGANVGGPDIQTASENGRGGVNVSASNAQRGQQYLDRQLGSGKPVVVGVNHKAGSPNADGVTDHYVVVTGRGVDDKGRKFYSFHDPAASVGSNRGKDTNPSNRFYVDEKTGGLYKPKVSDSGYVIDKRYDVAAVLGN
jgi:LysM repeat protein